MSHYFETGMMVRQPAWHGLGEVLDFDPTPGEAILAAGLNWNVNVCPMFADLPDESRIATGYNAIVRDCDQSVFGVVKGVYRTYQNS